MKNFKYSALFLATLSASAQANEPVVNQSKMLKTIDGVHFIVKFKDSSIHNSLRSTPETSEAMQGMTQSDATGFARTHNISAAPISSETVFQPIEAQTGLELDHARSASLGYDEITVDTTNPDAAIKSLMATGQFSSVEPVYAMYPAALDANDPEYKEQFYLKPYSNQNRSGSNMEVIHSKLNSVLGRKVRFAVLDSGSLTHEDVTFSDGYNFVSTSVEADRGRGVDTNAKYVKNDGTSCKSEHGLAVSSIISATSNNGIGMTGAFPSDKAEIIPVRVLGCHFGSGVDVMEGLLWAAGGEVTGVPKISKPVDVANLSLGSVASEGCSRYQQDIINKVVKMGVRVIVAAGNNNIPSSQHSPGACANVITVGAINTAGDKANFSNYGASLDVVAEGYSVTVASEDADGNDQYVQGGGTSYAAPLVSALVGAMIAQEPSISGVQAEARLKTTAIKQPGRSIQSNCKIYGCGSGLIQAQSALGLDEKQSGAYSVQHRYEGLSTPADEKWMTSLQPKSIACETLKYTMGSVGFEKPGVTYKVFITQSGGSPSFIKEVSMPQFVYQTSNSSTLSFQRCENGSCSEPVVMFKGSVQKPAVCS